MLSSTKLYSEHKDILFIFILKLNVYFFYQNHHEQGAKGIRPHIKDKTLPLRPQ